MFFHHHGLFPKCRSRAQHEVLGVRGMQLVCAVAVEQGLEESKRLERGQSADNRNEATQAENSTTDHWKRYR